MNVRFLCPNCEYPVKLDLPAQRNWQCPQCDHRLMLQEEQGLPLEACTVCGNHELYKKKDFPHGLGMAILVVACIVSFITYLQYQKVLTWTILLGTALVDGLFYLLVGDVIVCYRCNAHYRGIPKGLDVPLHDLGIAERYRQERLRREALRAEK